MYRLTRETFWRVVAVVAAVLVLAVGGWLCAQGTGGGMGWCEP